MTGLDPLLELLASCVVAVERDGRFEGTGFWVAPGELLTCAHVVHGGKPITVTVGSVQLPAEPVSPLLAPDDPAARFYPQPDVALLRVADAPAGHRCVRLDAAVPAVGSDVLQLTAFTVGENAPGRVVRSGASLHLGRPAGPARAISCGGPTRPPCKAPDRHPARPASGVSRGHAAEYL